MLRLPVHAVGIRKNISVKKGVKNEENTSTAT